jgi:hypothetical protein
LENQGKEITPQEYKDRVLRQRFAEALLEREDIIATQATRIAQLESELAERRKNGEEETSTEAS